MPLTPEAERQRQHLFNVIDDSVGNLLYYNRKEDEDLPVGVIEKLVADGVVTLDEIVARFRSALEPSFKGR